MPAAYLDDRCIWEVCEASSGGHLDDVRELCGTCLTCFLTMCGQSKVHSDDFRKATGEYPPVLLLQSLVIIPFSHQERE